MGTTWLSPNSKRRPNAGDMHITFIPTIGLRLKAIMSTGPENFWGNRVSEDSGDGDLRSEAFQIFRDRLVAD